MEQENKTKRRIYMTPKDEMQAALTRFARAKPSKGDVDTEEEAALEALSSALPTINPFTGRQQVRQAESPPLTPRYEPPTTTPQAQAPKQLPKAEPKRIEQNIAAKVPPIAQMQPAQPRQPQSQPKQPPILPKKPIAPKQPEEIPRAQPVQPPEQQFRLTEEQQTQELQEGEFVETEEGGEIHIYPRSRQEEFQLRYKYAEKSDLAEDPDYPPAEWATKAAERYEALKNDRVYEFLQTVASYANKREEEMLDLLGPARFVIPNIDGKPHDLARFGTQQFQTQFQPFPVRETVAQTRGETRATAATGAPISGALKRTDEVTSRARVHPIQYYGLPDNTVYLNGIALREQLSENDRKLKMTYSPLNGNFHVASEVTVSINEVLFYLRQSAKAIRHPFSDVRFETLIRCDEFFYPFARAVANRMLVQSEQDMKKKVMYSKILLSSYNELLSKRVDAATCSEIRGESRAILKKRAASNL